MKTVQRESQRRRVVWALLISAGLHGLAVLLVLLRPHPPIEAVGPAHKPIELTVIEMPAVEPPKPAPQPPKPEIAKRDPRKNVDRHEASKPTAVQAPTAPQTAQKSGAPGKNEPLDAPQVITLVPGGDFAVAPAGDPDGPRGHTLHNSPDERPDPVAMNEYVSEKLSRRINGQVEGMLAKARSESGLVDPYFMGARKAMEGDMSGGDIPRPKEKSLGREALKGYLDTQERYGKTGSPLAAGDLKEWDNESLSRGDSQGMNIAAHDAQWAGTMHQAEQSMAAMEITRRSLDHAIMSAELELVQEPGGGIADSHITKSSGYTAFDEYVLHHARTVFNKLDDPPEKGHGISSAGWRTYWRFSYYAPSVAQFRGQRVRVELLRVETGQGSGNPLEHIQLE